MGDTVGRWEVPLSDGVHIVEFEHGTISGKRLIRVDGKEVHREDWMFKLVGREYFQVGKAKCCVTIDTDEVGFGYEYTLEVNNKSLEKFRENQNKVVKAWHTYIAGEPYRVCLEKDTLDVYVNGQKVETAGEFTDDGTETHFGFGSHMGCIRAATTGHRRDGIVHSLEVNGVEVFDNPVPMFGASGAYADEDD